MSVADWLVVAAPLALVSLSLWLLWGERFERPRNRRGDNRKEDKHG